MKRNILFFLVATLTVSFLMTACSGTVGSGEKIRIGLHPEIGDASKLHYTTAQTISQKMMGMSIKVEQVTELFLTQTVESKDEKGLLNVKVAYERVKFMMDNAMTGKTEYDSDNADPNAETPAMAAGYQVLVGKSFTMKINDKGEVVDVIGVEELFDGMAETMDGMPGDAEMKEKMKATFGPESMKRNMQQLVAVFPDALVGVGDTWKDKTELAGEFGLAIENVYMLESVNDNEFVLSMESEISTEEGAKIDLGVMAMEYELTGSQEGTMEMDRKSGMLKRSEMTQKIKGTVKAGGMNIPMDIKSTITVAPY